MSYYVTFYSSDPSGIPNGWPKEIRDTTFSGAVVKTQSELDAVISSLQSAKNTWNVGQQVRTDESIYVKTLKVNGAVDKEAWYEWYNSTSDNSGPTRYRAYTYTSLGKLTSIVETVYKNNGEVFNVVTYNYFTEGTSAIQILS